MAEYTYKDVIIDPEDPRVEIGAEYYYGGNAVSALEMANEGRNEKKLAWVYNGDDFYQRYIFGLNEEKYGDGFIPTSFLIRKKEPSYTERQAKWIAENGIKIGDKVRIIREANDYEDGWGVKWAPVMNEAIGNVGTVCFSTSGIGDSGIEVDVPGVGLYLYPYFVLEKVEQKYVPFDFDDPEVRKELMGKTIINNYGLDGDGEFREVMIVGFMNKSDEDRDCYGSNGDTEGTIAMTIDGYFHADELLKECTFLDGTPCGKLEEVEE